MYVLVMRAITTCANDSRRRCRDGNPSGARQAVLHVAAQHAVSIRTLRCVDCLRRRWESEAAARNGAVSTKCDSARRDFFSDLPGEGGGALR